MTTEQKAKAYDKAIEKVNSKWHYKNQPFLVDAAEIFPELKESEDELEWLTNFIKEETYYRTMDIRDDEDRIRLKNLKRSLAWLRKQGDKTRVDNFDRELKESEDDKNKRISKEITQFLKQNNGWNREWLAWLEKQGDKDTFIKEELECIKGYRENAIKRLKELEKQGEQKSIDDLTQQEAMDIAVAKCFESGGVCTNPLIDCNDCLKRFGDGSTTITTSQTILKEETECDNKKQKIVFPIKWTQDNIDDLTEFEAAMMHVGESFFGEYAGLNPNDTMSVRVEAKLLLELAPKSKWTEEDESKLQNLIDMLSHFKEEQLCGYPVAIYLDWLKSLGNGVLPKP